MTPLLSINGLTKKFGRIIAVNDLNLEISEGMVFGMLGPNGSGKTTTLGMVLGVTIPTKGTFTWLGRGNDHNVRKNIGAILEKPVFYPYMSAYESLKLVCKIKELDETRIMPSLDLTGLLGREHDAFKTYSLGMKQRLAIASAMLSDPKVLILDEPTNGLDPQGIAAIRNLILEIARTGKTIILASHLLDEVQRVCTDFCVLKKGVLLFKGNVKDTLYQGNSFDIAASNLVELRTVLSTIPEVRSVDERGDILRVLVDDTMLPGDLNMALAQRGVYLDHLVTVKKSLEEQFLDILNQSNETVTAD